MSLIMFPTQNMQQHFVTCTIVAYPCYTAQQEDTFWQFLTLQIFVRNRYKYTTGAAAAAAVKKKIWLVVNHKNPHYFPSFYLYFMIYSHRLCNFCLYLFFSTVGVFPPDDTGSFHAQMKFVGNSGCGCIRKSIQSALRLQFCLVTQLFVFLL